MRVCSVNSQDNGFIQNNMRGIWITWLKNSFNHKLRLYQTICLHVRFYFTNSTDLSDCMHEKESPKSLLMQFRVLWSKSIFLRNSIKWRQFCISHCLCVLIFCVFWDNRSWGFYEIWRLFHLISFTFFRIWVLIFWRTFLIHVGVHFSGVNNLKILESLKFKNYKIVY